MFDRKEWNRQYYLKNKNKLDAQCKAWKLANLKRQAYLACRWDAKHRGVAFLISFADWVTWWGEDFEKRGLQPHDLQMGRVGDKGAYELGNIYKVTARQNKIDFNQRVRTKDISVREGMSVPS